MAFNPKNSSQFLLMTKRDIWIGISEKIFVYERGMLKETDDYRLKIHCTEKHKTTDVGRLTCFTFVESTSQILVGCSRGGILVFGYTMEYNQELEDTNFENLRYIKVLKVDRYRINVIKSIDGVIVTGNSAGEIHFFDDHIRLMYWVHGFTVDSVKGLYFNVMPRSYEIFDPKCRKICPCWEKVETTTDEVTGIKRQKLLKMKTPTDATTRAKPFLVRDFLILTHNQGIGFVDFVTEKLTTVLDYQISPATSLSVHPEKQIACIGYQDGNIEMFLLNEHRIFTRLHLREYYKIVIPPRDESLKGDCEITIPQLSVTCLKYAPSGVHLACGLNNGQLLFLDPTTLEIKTPKPFKDTKFAIKDIAYSEDSLTLAFSDTGKTVCVYKYDCDTQKWTFIGKHRAHYKDITTVLFLPRKNPNGDYKLISLGTDRIMVEYDIGQSKDECLEILSLDRMDQSAVPLTAINWPTPKYVDPETCKMDLPLILVANDQHKYKIINYDTTMTLSTILGPRYEQPVNKIELISRIVKDEEVEYLLFATKYVIGLQRLPLDGNPWKHAAQLGHPNRLTVMNFRQDLNNLYTIGSKDNCMVIWSAVQDSVDATTLAGGGDLDPYYCLIENGRPGWLFQEIRDLFYYIQILCQGTFSPAQRGVKDYIPIDSLPDLMRALGYFPSEYEVENLLVEARHKIYQKKPVTEIDFEDFVKLYLNHRPALGENVRKIRNAFKTFATFRRDEYVVDRDMFVDILSEYGENFPRNLSWYLLSIVSGIGFDDRAQMSPDDFTFLPKKLKLHDLLTTIMGVPDADAMIELLSVPDSLVSQNSGSSLESAKDTEFNRMWI
ncbi:cilia- and flagella-associated protein 251-like [Hyposmocoma kahamanoa]|uniref:cilia- and flagella-associated protein 251-like n=1 Tax=Hyposmocoma kahamanoa TaxID=1477025 RepID=UPI000E6D909F|nr:cilia- and flagella-associated protein 251-like [Hyposmocoma kahamanoa]